MRTAVFLSFYRFSEIISRFSMQISRTPSINSQDILRLRSRSSDYIIERFINHFRGRRPSSWQRVLFASDDGLRDGVTREAFSLFWDAVVGILFVSHGGDIHLPSITPCQNAEVWEILGRILAFTLVVLGQFPFNCISETLCQAILRLQPESDHEALVTNFFNSLGERQRNLLIPLSRDLPLFSNEGVDGLQRYIQRRRQELLDLLREFNVPSVPAANERRSTMINVARHTLLEISSAAINAMQVGFFYITGSTFNGVTGEMVSSWYREQLRPLFEEICRRLQLESTEEGSERVSNVLIVFLRQHRFNEDLLHRFPRCCTGSTNARGDSIRVNIKSSVMAISHATCFLSMELPMIADDREAEQEFANQLLA